MRAVDKEQQNIEQSEAERYQKLLDKLDDTQFLGMVCDNKFEVLVDIASRASSDSLVEEKALAMAGMTFARQLAISQRFNSDGQANFLKLGPDVEEVAQRFHELTLEQRKQYFRQWLSAIGDYLRISADGYVVVQDDKGRQFLIDETASVVPIEQKLDGLQRIPNTENGRMASFLALRAVLGGKYHSTEILGFTSQGK